MSVQDETWDRPRCNICCTDIKHGEKHKHGAGKCDSDAAHSKRDTGLQCPHCYQMVKYEDKAKHDGGKCNEICVNCGCPVHPCLPCGEVVMLNGNHTDDTYCDLLKLILRDGRVKKNRTGVDTIGVFGAQAKFDVCMDAFPILTTKKVWFKGIVHELLWFIKGDTNIKYLVDNGVHIWDEWGCKRWMDTLGAGPKNMEFLLPKYVEGIRNEPDFAAKYGELGEGTYGGMWRTFPYHTNEDRDPLPGEYWFPSGGKNATKLGHVNQLGKIISKLKTNPDDRRMIVSAWHPYWVDHCALPPCHCLFHFNTEELTLEERKLLFAYDDAHYVTPKEIKSKEWTHEEYDKYDIPRRRLNLLLYQRSCDTFLGVPFNITSYSLLLAMVAHCVGMEPGTFTHTYGDLHLYKNHLLQVKLQLSRTPKVLPSLWINPSKKDLFEFTYDDIKLNGYDPHPTIKAEIAV